jgi:nickel transport protein
MVHSDNYFTDGTKCKNSIVEVFDEKSGTKLLEGKTDEEGKFSIKIPKITSLKLVLVAGMGHRAEFTLSEDEVREAMGIKGRKSEVQSQKPSPSTKEEREGITIAPSITNTEIEAIVEGAIDKKLQPMMRMLVKLQENAGRPGITEIIGGIGYIIGILGIVAYFKKPKGEIRTK